MAKCKEDEKEKHEKRGVEEGIAFAKSQPNPLCHPEETRDLSRSEAAKEQANEQDPSAKASG
jgi:hypothetical protein